MENIKPALNTFGKRFAAKFLTFQMKENAKYSKNSVLDVLLEASSLNGFVEGSSNAMNQYGKYPNGDTVLGYLKVQKREEIESIFISQIRETIEMLRKNGRLSHAVPIAIDWQDEMFYGNKETEMVLGTRHKNGSNYAYEYLSASVLVYGERIILGALPIETRKEIADKAIQLIQIIENLEVKIEYLLFDRGFFIIKLIRFLEVHKIPYEIYIQKNDKLKKLNLKNEERIAYVPKGHIPSVREYGIQFDVVKVIDKKEDEEIEYFFATNLKESASTLLENYKKRWGIETNNRINNQFLIKTTSKNYVVRLFFYLFSCLLQNIWILMNLFSKEHLTVLEMKILFLFEWAKNCLELSPQNSLSETDLNGAVQSLISSASL